MPAIGADRPALEIVEHGRRVGAGLHAVDDAADRVDGLQQAPERAEQAEEHQQPDEVAVELAPLVEAVPIESRIARGGRGRQAARACAGVEQRRHRPEQARLTHSSPPSTANQRIDPVDFAEQPEHLAEGEQRADRQHAENQAVEAGIGGEGEEDLLVENEDGEADQNQKRRHADEKDARRSEEANGPIGRH